MNPKISTLFKLRIILLSLVIGYIGTVIFTELMAWPQGGIVLTIGYVGSEIIGFLARKEYDDEEE